jgi:hypothetical protein
MPFEAAQSHRHEATERWVAERKAAYARDAAEALIFIHQKFATREWHWIQSRVMDGRNGYCLMGAVCVACRTQLDGVPTSVSVTHYLVRAITKCLTPKCGLSDRDIISFFNDSYPFEAVMDVLSTALHLADTDAGACNAV